MRTLTWFLVLLVLLYVLSQTKENYCPCGAA